MVFSQFETESITKDLGTYEAKSNEISAELRLQK